MKKTVLLLLVLLLVLAQTVALADDTPEKKDTWLVDEPVTIEIMLNEAPLVPISDDFRFLQYLYEETGIKVELLGIPTSDYEAKKQLALGSDDFPDIIKLNTTDIGKFASEDIFVCLSDYADQIPNYFALMEEKTNSLSTLIDGECYGFTTLSRWDLVRGSALVMREDILNDLSIDPASIVTYDDFYAVLEQVKEAYPDMIPFITRNGITQQMKNIGYTLGSGWSMFYDNEKGTWVYGPYQEETKEVLSYLRNMFTDGLIDPNYSVATSAEWQAYMASNTGFSFLDNSTFAATNLAALQKLDPDANWIAIPIPENSFGYSRMLYTAPDILSTNWVVNANTEHLDAILKLFNYLYTDEGSDLLSLGREGVDFYRDEDGVPHLTDETMAMYASDGVFVKTAMHSDCGNAAYECFVPYYDLRSYFVTLTPMESAIFAVEQSDSAYTFPAVTPPFNDEERELVSDLTTKLDTIATNMCDKIIMGYEDLDAYETYRQQLIDAGVEQLQEIYNTAYQRMLGN